MKKIAIFVVIAAVIAVIAVGGWYFLKPSREEVTPAEILPADTLMMVELIDLERSIDNFKSGKLGQKLKEIDFGGVMQKLGVQPNEIENYIKIKTSILSTIDGILFKEIFGQEAVVAILSIKIDSLEPKELIKALGSVVLISRPKHNADIVGFISRVFATKLDCQTENYSGYVIHGCELENDLSVYFSLADGLMIISLDRETVKKCLDLRVNNQTSLANNEYYQKLRDRLGSSEIRGFVYNNTEKMYENILDIVRLFSSKEDKLAGIERSLASLKGLKAIGYASYDDGSDLLYDKMLVMLDKSGMDPVYAKLYSIKPKTNKTLKMVPNNTMGYYWANTLDLMSYLELYSRESFLSDEAKKSIEAKFEKAVGISLDEVLHAFGNEFGLTLTDIVTGGPFPIPKLTFFIEVTNQDTVVKLIESAIQKFGIGLEQEAFEDVEISYLVLPFGKNIQPSYALFNGYCMISISRQLIKDMISTYKNGGDITSDPDFQYINQGLTEKNNSVMFIKFGRFIDRIEQVVSWGNNLMAFKNQESVEKGRIILNGVVNPFLEGLKMYKTVGARTVIKENEIETDWICKIERQNR